MDDDEFDRLLVGVKFDVVHIVCWRNGEVLKDNADMERHYADVDCLARHDIIPANTKLN